MASSIILMLLCTVLTVAGLKEDRYVVRENSPVGMDCNHEQENVTRVLWKYKSTHDKTTETIYDSKSNKSLRTGFEISCTHNQIFISTCFLKMIQAKKEDSGKYICYVGQGNYAKFDSNLLKPIIEIELVIKGPINQTIVVTKGDSVILPCEHNLNYLTRARWSHVSLQGVLTYQLYYMSWKSSSNNNYKGLCEPHQPSCNLKILQANKESAGRYICMVGESLEFEKKYGLFEMTYFIEIQLVVGELLCNENMNKDLTLIGENDCYGIEADVLNLKCSFNYFGNITYNLLHLRWIEKYKFNSLEKKLNSSLINHEVKDETNKISIQTNLSVAYEMQNSVFQCVLEDTLVKPCQLHEFRTQYAKNTTARFPSMHSNDLHNIKCSANKSANVQCSYYWVHEIAGAMVENPHAILPVENMNSPGNYTCIAKCYLGKRKDCIIKVMELEVIQEVELRLSGLNIGLISALIAVIFIQLFILLGPRLKKIIASLNLKWRLLKRKRKVKVEEFGMIGIKTLQEEGHHPLLSSTSASLVRIKHSKKEAIEMIKELSLPLGVKEILAERTSEHGDILIYDSKNSFHDRVLMIDEALWDTSFLGNSNLETMTLKLLESHLNPKKVLVIGRFEGRIVRSLIRRGVESVHVYDIDESGSDQAKELYYLYCKYFPSLALCLHHRKVLHINGGADFLKNQQNVFDFIIIRSSGKSPYNYLFTKEYFDSVKSALKEGGIALFIGQSVEESMGSGDFVEDVQLLCKQLFPVVKYFQFRNIDHPSCLTRGVLCDLSQDNTLTNQYAKDV